MIGLGASKANTEWRKHPALLAKNNIKKMFPGLLPALGLFAVYCAADYAMKSTEAKTSGKDAHGKETHGKH